MSFAAVIFERSQIGNDVGKLSNRKNVVVLRHLGLIVVAKITILPRIMIEHGVWIDNRLGKILRRMHAEHLGQLGADVALFLDDIGKLFAFDLMAFVTLGFDE